MSLLSKIQHLRVKSEQLLSFYVKNLTSVLYLGLLCGHSSLEKYTMFFFKVGNLALLGAPAFGLLLCLVRVAQLSDCLVL